MCGRGIVDERAYFDDGVRQAGCLGHGLHGRTVRPGIVFEELVQEIDLLAGEMLLIGQIYEREREREREDKQVSLFRSSGEQD